MYSKLMAVEPIECFAGIFGWVRRSRLYWGAACGGFSAPQRGLELPLGVQISREGTRCVVQWRGKPIPETMRAVDGFQLITRKPRRLSIGMERERSFLSRGSVSTPTRRPRPQQMSRADGSKMAVDRELGVERCRMAHAHGRGESYVAWFLPRLPGGGEAHADE